MAEETQEELMERIKNMSPEELAEFQKSRCIFCHIISGKIPARKIYEDEIVVAILDINPATIGHILLMPKEHYTIMPQIPKEVLDHVFTIAKKLSQTILQGIGAKGTSILIQNGVAAGQKAQHFMIHIIPRRQDDGVGLIPPRKGISDENYKVLKERISQRIMELKNPQKAVPQEKTESTQESMPGAAQIKNNQSNSEKKVSQEEQSAQKKELGQQTVFEKEDISEMNQEVSKTNEDIEHLQKSLESNSLSQEKDTGNSNIKNNTDTNSSDERSNRSSTEMSSKNDTPESNTTDATTNVRDEIKQRKTKLDSISRLFGVKK
ncbi:MAG: HIT family protein [Candidatus Woesearchaeota archaeon]